MIFFDNHPDVFQACTRLLEVALGRVEFIIIAHDVAAVGVFYGKQQLGAFLLDFNLDEAVRIGQQAAFDSSEGVLQRIAEDDGKVNIVEVDFLKLDISSKMDTAFLRLQLPVAKQTVECFVAVELDALDAVRVFENGAQVLPQLVIFLLLIKLVEQDNKMLLVVAQTA